MSLPTRDVEVLLITAERVRVLARELEAADSAHDQALSRLNAAQAHRAGVDEQLRDARNDLRLIVEGSA